MPPSDSTRRRYLLATATIGFAGCAGDGSNGATPTPGQPLALDRIRFVVDRPSDYRAVERQPEQIYAPGSAVWVYLEPSGVSRAKGRIQLRLEAAFVDPDGEPVTSLTDTVDRNVEGQSLDELYLWAGARIREVSATGRWRVEIGLQDALAGTETSAAREFSVAAADESASPLEQFLSTILSETDVTDVQATVSDGAVELSYVSVHETDATDWRS